MAASPHQTRSSLRPPPESPFSKLVELTMPGSPEVEPTLPDRDFPDQAPQENPTSPY